MTKKFRKSVEGYAKEVTVNNSTMFDNVEHEDEILTILNMTPKTTTRRDRMARKRKAKEHDYEIMFDKLGKGR